MVFIINKLFSIIMKVSEKFSYTLKKMREKEIKLYHFIKIKFRLICFRLMQNKKYVCFSGAGVIFESLRVRGLVRSCVFAMCLFCSSLSYAISNPCCAYLDVGDITVYRRFEESWYPVRYTEFKYYNSSCSLLQVTSNYNLLDGQVRCACTSCEYPLVCASPYRWSLRKMQIKTIAGGTVLYEFMLTAGTPGVLQEFYIYACLTGQGTNPSVTPLFNHTFTASSITYDARMVSKAVYDTLEKNPTYPYHVKCLSFVPDWGTGVQNDGSQKGGKRKYLGTRKKGIGGYEKAAP